MYEDSGHRHGDGSVWTVTTAIGAATLVDCNVQLVTRMKTEWRGRKLWGPSSVLYEIGY